MKNSLSNLPQRVRRHTPTAFRSFSDMENEMERWIEQTRREWVNDYQGTDFVPACNLKENAKEYIIEFDIPGVRKENVKIEIENNRLTVSGERQQKNESKDVKEFFSENFYGSFMRSFQLSSAVDENKVDAHYEDGVLTIKVPKLQSSKAKEVKIH